MVDLTITRTVKNPRNATIKPADPHAQAVISELQSHPEFALSRREIAKYIVTPPAQRSTDVQNLLRLEYIGGLRKVLVNYANKRKRDAEEAERARHGAEGDLKTACGLAELKREKVIEKANERRAILGLLALKELPPKTSFKEGAAEESAGKKTPGIAKDVALADPAVLTDPIEAGEPAALKEHRESARLGFQKLKEDEKALSLARAHGFIRAAPLLYG